MRSAGELPARVRRSKSDAFAFHGGGSGGHDGIGLFLQEAPPAGAAFTLGLTSSARRRFLARDAHSQRPQLILGQRREQRAGQEHQLALIFPVPAQIIGTEEFSRPVQHLSALGVLGVAHVSHIPTTNQRTGEFLWPTSWRAPRPSLETTTR